MTPLSSGVLGKVGEHSGREQRVSGESEWFAERELEFRESDSAPPRKVFARIGVPEEVETDYWRCATLIEGAPTMGTVFHAYGIDSIQALQLALQALAVRLQAVGRTGVLTWLDTTDLGFSASGSAGETVA